MALASRLREPELPVVGQVLAYADICVICDNIKVGRDLVRALEGLGINVLHTFDEDDRKQRLQKLYFFKGSERLKVTTVDSFKGWESRAVVVVLTIDDSRAMRRLYSGITRVKQHDRSSFLAVVASVPAVTAFGLTAAA